LIILPIFSFFIFRYAKVMYIAISNCNICWVKMSTIIIIINY